jgi:Beta-propeller repeat
MKLMNAVLAVIVFALLVVPKGPRSARSSAVRAPSASVTGATRLGASGLALSAPDSAARALIMESYGKLPLGFEANQGQFDARVKFRARGTGYTLSLASHEAVLELRGRGQPAKNETAGRRSLFDNAASRKLSADTERPAVVAMQLVGANTAAKISGLEELPGKSSYFIGNDPEKWHRDVRNYAKVRYQGVYSGVDLVYYGKQGRLEYDFVVAPGGDAKAIRLAFMETSRDLNIIPPLRVDHSGDLVVRLAGNEIRFHRPTVYQMADHSEPSASSDTRRFIDARYILKSKGQVAIQLAPYDRTKALVIDPVLTYSSYLGGSSFDDGIGIAVDNSGNVYIAGLTRSVDFQRLHQIKGACAKGCRTGGDDAFVTKINSVGTALVYSSYLGGNGSDQALGIAVDASGNAYVTGFTGSSDFPRVNQIPGACQGSCGTGSSEDAFVAKVSAAGDALVYSSLIGGSGNDEAEGIAVDGSGNAYLAGDTISSDFPRVNQIPGACQGACGGGSLFDAFVTEINAAGSALVYSSYVGGSDEDLGLGIAVDGSGNAYLTGRTFSTDFPRVNQIPGACTGTCGSGGNSDDGFVTKINAAGNALVYSNYVGGSGLDEAVGIAVDGSGNAYLTGDTTSTDFPRVNQILAACQGSCGTSQSNGDAFVTKVNPAGSALVYSSYLGGSFGDAGRSIAVDVSGNAYVTGDTNSPDFPNVNPIPGACQGGCGTGSSVDAFVTEVNSAGNALAYSSYLGGSNFDEGMGIAVDSLGNAYVTGDTLSSDFPRVNQIPGSCQKACGSGTNTDGFVTKVSP